MSKRVFVKFVSDPNNDLIKTIVGLACAARAVADGHEVNVFFAAAGTRILEASYIEKLERELDSPEPMVGPMMDAIVQGATLHCSFASVKAVLGHAEGDGGSSGGRRSNCMEWPARRHCPRNIVRRSTHLLNHARPARHLRTPFRWAKAREHGGNHGTQRRQHQEGNRSYAHSSTNPEFVHRSSH